jgi:glycerol-3-phosphate cytidylyltransferase
MIKGFCIGVFDLFHFGHYEYLLNAKRNCDYLIVGVSSDSLVRKVKGIKPNFCYKKRFEMVKGLKCVDEVICKRTVNNIYYFEKLGFDIVFVGSCHKNTDKWINFSKKLKDLGVKVVFLPYNQSISSSKIREAIK